MLAQIATAALSDEYRDPNDAGVSPAIGPGPHLANLEPVAPG
jgi:hypothetical protein